MGEGVNMGKIKLGFVPTRRSVFSSADAVKYAELTRQKMKSLGVDFIDLTGINNEGLFFDEKDREVVTNKFKAAQIDGLFIAHCNFGTEYICARLAKDLGVPVLIWGPRDEAPDSHGIRLRDSQCGIFATGKVLRRFNVKFTYMINCHVDDVAFERGLQNFIAVCNVVKTFKNINILQIGPRPFDFWSTMCNEGELLEKFHIQISPVPLPELTEAVLEAQKDIDAIKDIEIYCRTHMIIRIPDDSLKKIIAMKIAIRNLADTYGCQAAAIQCWNALPKELGIMPCAANALLNEEGFPVACETDIHGAITSLMAESACLDGTRSFFADWTIRHPDNKNGELLQHCGPWPISVLSQKPEIGYPLVFDYPGAIEAPAKMEPMTICRFDGDHGQYSLLLGRAKGIPGPPTKGTYTWIEVKNWPSLERKLVEGPYIHHCVGIYKNIVPVLYEACKYLNIYPDLYDSDEKEYIQNYLYGEE